MENIMLGIAGTFQPLNLAMCAIGLLVGTIFGALPGFTATMGVAVFLPFTYALEPSAALLLLSGIYCGGIYGGAIPAVLLGIPGTAASAPTAIDGSALTRRGESGRALGLATIASAFGGFISAVCLLLFAPALAEIAMMVGPPEQLMIAIFGLSVVCMMSYGNILKGLLVAVVSLLIATIGQDPYMGYPRFSFGMYQMIAGLDTVAVLIGLFSLPEVFKMLKDPFGKLSVSEKVSKMEVRRKDITSNIKNAIRSTVIGVVVGIIPAAGPNIASFLAYNEAKKATKHPEEFGNGSVEAIIASEASNNGVTGGSLIPLLTLSIPGSAPAALFLGAMIIHGLQPGPLLFTENAEIVYTLMVGFAVINIMLLFIGWYFCKYAGLALLISKSILATVIVVLATIGTFSINQNMFDVFVMYGSGIVGYILVSNHFSLSPVALALLLGPMMENALMLSQVMYPDNLMQIFTRPMTILFAVFTLISVIYPFLAEYLRRNKKAREECL